MAQGPGDQRQIVDDLNEKLAALKGRRRLFEPTFQDIITYILPRLREFDVSDAGKTGKRYGEHMHMGEPLNALRMASDGLQGYMTPKSSPWVRLEMQHQELMEYDEVRTWLQEVNKLLLAALERSNFYDQLGETFDNGLSLGTAVLLVDRDDTRGIMSYRSRHLAECWIAEDEFGRVDTMFREFEMTGKKILEKFGEENLSKKLLRDIQGAPFKRLTVRHAMFPRDKRVYGKLDKQNKPIADIYWLADEPELVRNSGYDHMRGVVWRYRKQTEEEYGTAPGWDALVDSMRGHQLARTMTRAAQQAVDPMMAVPKEMRGKLKFQPKGMVYYTNPQRIPFPLSSGVQYPLGADQEERFRKAIKDHFHSELFLLMANLDRTKTATEAVEIAGERAALMSPATGRIESELLDPILELTFHMEYEAGNLPEPPPIMFEVQGGDVMKFDYIGPLSQLQKRHFGQRNIIQAMGQVAPYMQLVPSSMDIVDFDALVKKVLIGNGMDEDIIRDDKMVAQLRQVRAEQAQQQQQMQAMQAMAQSYKDTNAPAAPGSPAEQMEEAMQESGRA